MGPVARYTRFVALIKSSLWVLVALTVGVVIWIASDNTGEKGARLVFSNLPKTGAIENIMSQPRYQGVDAHNRPYSITADEGVQLDANHINLKHVRADMTLTSGAWVALNAGSGHLNPQTKQLDLTGGVDVFYDNGYEFRTDHAHVDIQKGTAYGDAPVQGQGPAGTLQADGFTAGNRGQDIRFNGSVRMTLYH